MTEFKIGQTVKIIREKVEAIKKIDWALLDKWKPPISPWCSEMDETIGKVYKIKDINKKFDWYKLQTEDDIRWNYWYPSEVLI